MRTRNSLALVLVAALLGCSEPTPEARLESAGVKLEETEDSLEALNQRIEELEDELAGLNQKRRRTEVRVMTLEDLVEARATDVAVFRAVQSALLDAPALNQAAISVDARGGLVTLSGVVATEELRQQAVDIARGTAGVENVKSRIDLVPPASGDQSGSDEAANN